MKQLTFKEFDEQFKEYYQIYEDDNYTIESENDMAEVCYDLFNTANFEIDYDNKIIIIY